MDVSHLKRLLHLFPESYHSESCWLNHQGSRIASHLLTMQHHEQATTATPVASSNKDGQELSSFTNEELYKRRTTLYQRLLQRVRKEYETWAEKHHVHVESELGSWHPRFPLASVPPIPTEASAPMLSDTLATVTQATAPSAKSEPHPSNPAEAAAASPAPLSLLERASHAYSSLCFSPHICMP